MRVKELRLMNYRNYASLRLEPDEGLCVLTGENAAGKTNVIEALFLAALGRSHRTAHDQELIKSGTPGGSVRVVLETRGGTREIAIRLQDKDTKRISVDGTALSRSGELMGCLNVVLFAPEDLSLVKGGAGERRRFMDMEISQIRPAYYYLLQQYNTALKQRNALLKEAELMRPGMLDPWNEQLAHLGARVTAAREEFVAELGEIARTTHFSISGGKELLEVGYESSIPETGGASPEERMLNKLNENLERDIFRGHTSVGPHRDDLRLILDGTDARVYGSQGQQRTVALSLKLSDMEVIKRTRGEMPVLLLDDVFSELDRNRQEMLLKTVEGAQTFVTCTHLEVLTGAGADRMQVYAVKDGNVTEV
ncbi:MAG: DNA replication/repair protein RecF [Clostridia bacterium]|nr:DNA replication/repair protein RecF [Clostridia bacterium]